MKRAESDGVVVALWDRGYPVRYLVAEDEGHGFRGAVSRLAQYAATEAFLAEHLGGRAEASMEGEVAERLAELTGDPASVALGASG